MLSGLRRTQSLPATLSKRPEERLPKMGDGLCHQASRLGRAELIKAQKDYAYGLSVLAHPDLPRALRHYHEELTPKQGAYDPKEVFDFKSFEETFRTNVRQEQEPWVDGIIASLAADDVDREAERP